MSAAVDDSAVLSVSHFLERTPMKTSQRPPNRRPPTQFGNAESRFPSTVPLQSPTVGIDRCGVQLRRVPTAERFPNPSLIRCRSVGKTVDIRLVPSDFSSVSQRGTFLLLGDKCLIIWNGNESTVSERSKIAQLAASLRSDYGNPQIAEDDPKIEHRFFRLLNSPEGPKFAPNPITDQLFCELFSESFRIFKFEDKKPNLLECKTLDSSILTSDSIFVLDFGSEIYIWIGKDSDRSVGNFAADFVQQIKSEKLSEKMSEFLGKNERADWIITRRLSEGIPDPLFVAKFSDRRTVLAPTRLSAQIAKRASIRPKSPTAQISSEVLSNRLVNRLATEFNSSTTLELEGTTISARDPRVSTESFSSAVLIGEELSDFGEIPEELNSKNCYVFEWKYRIEITGIKRLERAEIGNVPTNHQTGRQRAVFFIWLGSETSARERSFCALALRRRDKERLEYIRMEEGNEHPIFVGLFPFGLIVASSLFIIHSFGGDGDIIAAMPTTAPRSQSIAAQIQSPNLRIHRGKLCSETLWKNSQQILKRIAQIHNLEIQTDEQMKEIRPIQWTKAPLFYRMINGDAEHIVAHRSGPNFLFPLQQKELTDSILVENDEYLWLWAEPTVPTILLKVAFQFWTKNRNQKPENAKIVYWGKEPKEFIALFPQWISETEPNEGIAYSLAELLAQRTQHRTLEEIQNRQLPAGADFSRLEDFLSDSDFLKIFGVERQNFPSIPNWKRIALKKKANIF